MNSRPGLASIIAQVWVLSPLRADCLEASERTTLDIGTTSFLSNGVQVSTCLPAPSCLLTFCVLQAWNVYSLERVSLILMRLLTRCILVKKLLACYQCNQPLRCSDYKNAWTPAYSCYIAHHLSFTRYMGYRHYTSPIPLKIKLKILHVTVYLRCQHSVSMKEVLCPLCSKVESKGFGGQDDFHAGDQNLHPVTDLQLSF